MLVAQIQDDYRIDLAERPIPPLPPKGALVKVIGCGVCGSDLDKFVHHKALPGSVLGHEVVGVIEALDDKHPDGWKLGDRIVTAHHVPCRQCHYCLNDSESMCRQFKSTNLNPGGFAEYFALSEAHLQHTAFRVPAEITSAEASCMEPLACVLRAVRRGVASSGGGAVNGSVLMVGLGFIGLMAAQVYQNDGYTVIGTDLDTQRIDLAKREGFVTAAFHPQAEANRLEENFNALPTGQVDVVFLTVVNSQTVELALSRVRDGGTLITFTSAPQGTQIDPTRLYFREINLITSYSPALADLQAAAHMIFHNKINVAPLVSHQLPLARIAEAFDLYRSGQAIKVFMHTTSQSPKETSA